MGLSGGVVGTGMIVIGQQYPKGFSASYWQSGACGDDPYLHPDCAKSLTEVKIRFPGSNRGPSAVGHGDSAAVFKLLTHLSPIVPVYKLICAQSLT